MSSNSEQGTQHRGDDSSTSSMSIDPLVPDNDTSDTSQAGALLLSQGAEARVYRLPSFALDKAAIVKERFSKAYRHPVLDRKLTTRRVVQESRCIARGRKVGVDTPCLYLVDTEKSRIYMEEIIGLTVKEFIYRATANNTEIPLEVLQKIGRQIGKLHGGDVIHGDLTTSNMMIRDADSSLVIIDFGLSHISSDQEDKAVDLYVLERAFISTHPNSEKLVRLVD